METESKPFDTLLRELILRWRDDSGGTYRNWFLWKERIKNFRSIRRGLVVQIRIEIDSPCHQYFHKTCLAGFVGNLSQFQTLISIRNDVIGLLRNRCK